MIAPSLQVALAGLGLDEQQLRRVVVILVEHLKQKTAQQQPVTLQVSLMLDRSSDLLSRPCCMSISQQYAFACMTEQ